MNCKNRFRSKKGFSVVELTVVLLVISTMIVAVISGRVVIQNARMQSIIMEARNLNTSFITFYDNYGGWPGVLKSKEQLVGAINNNLQYLCYNNTDGSTTYQNSYYGSTAGVWKNFCGYDNKINHNLQYIIPCGYDSTSICDMFGVDKINRDGWKQMALLGLIKGVDVSKNTIPQCSLITADAGKSIPLSNYSKKAGWFYASNRDLFYSEGSYPHIILGSVAYNYSYAGCNYNGYGNSDSDYVKSTPVGAVNPMLAQNIDAKIDDGNLETGSVVAAYGRYYSAYTSSNAARVTVTAYGIMNESGSTNGGFSCSYSALGGTCGGYDYNISYFKCNTSYPDRTCLLGFKVKGF